MEGASPRTMLIVGAINGHLELCVQAREAGAAIIAHCYDRDTIEDRDRAQWFRHVRPLAIQRALSHGHSDIAEELLKWPCITIAEQEHNLTRAYLKGGMMHAGMNWRAFLPVALQQSVDDRKYETVRQKCAGASGDQVVICDEIAKIPAESFDRHICQVAVLQGLVRYIDHPMIESILSDVAKSGYGDKICAHILGRALRHMNFPLVNVLFRAVIALDITLDTEDLYINAGRSGNSTICKTVVHFQPPRPEDYGHILRGAAQSGSEKLCASLVRKHTIAPRMISRAILRAAIADHASVCRALRKHSPHCFACLVIPFEWIEPIEKKSPHLIAELFKWFTEDRAILDHEFSFAVDHQDVYPVINRALRDNPQLARK